MCRITSHLLTHPFDKYVSTITTPHLHTEICKSHQETLKGTNQVSNQGGKSSDVRQNGSGYANECLTSVQHRNGTKLGKWS